MRPDATIAGCCSPVSEGNKRVSYVIKWTECGGPSFVNGRNCGDFAYTTDIQKARRFSAASTAMSWLLAETYISGTRNEQWNSGLEVVRVEETTLPSYREVVTSGDLSLLNKGPVVIYGAGVCDYLQDGDGKSYARWSRLDTARTFRNQHDALEFLAEQNEVGGPLEVHPIREIPGETIVTETVLA